MKQRRTCIIRPQPGNGKGTKPASAAWTKPGTSTEGKESWRFRWKGEPTGAVWVGRSLKSTGAKGWSHLSPLPLQRLAASSLHTDLSKIQIRRLQPAHGFPLSTRENPNSLACVQTHVVGPAYITQLLSHNAFVLFHAPPTLHSFIRLQALAHAVLDLATHFLHYLIWLTPSCLSRLSSVLWCLNEWKQKIKIVLNPIWHNGGTYPITNTSSF